MPRQSLVGLKILCACSLLIGMSSGVRSADPGVDQLEALPGFKLEYVLKADPKVNGSWICMAKDPQGRLLLGGQRGQAVTRITLKDGQVVKQENIKLPISETMGLLFAFDSLYVNGYGKNKEGKGVFGLFRCRDTQNNGTFDSVEFLREWQKGAGEHGAHGIVQGPDKKLYMVCGNFTALQPDLNPSSPHRNYMDDRILPRAEDGNGFGAGNKPPGGFVTRMDPDGQNAELFCAGERNTYDIGFNGDGELFGFDSDMEWDWGSPWYRPIRIFHAVSGGEQGFREGSAKWPEYYADSLPATVNIGIGCPTGVTFGTGAKFPAKYQKAFFVSDWTYGRLIAVHMQPKGASYTATWENFVAPKGLHGPVKTSLNLTDIMFGDDGAMYFTVGGRGTQASLYRVTYVGNEPTAPADLHDTAGTEDRALRHKIEAYQLKEDPAAVDFVWQYLNSTDRWIRYAARIALERQPVDQWKSKAIAEKQPEASLTSLLALARLGKSADQPSLLQALQKLPISSLDENQQLEKLRVIEVSICRQGKPSTDFANPIISELDAVYPAKTEFMNRELCQILLALDAPNAVSKTVSLLEAAPTQEEQLTYVLHLRTITNGWTPELRKRYLAWWPKDRKNVGHPDYELKWFEDAGRPYSDGASLNNFIGHLYNDVKASMKPEELTSLADVLASYTPPSGRNQPKKAVKVRKLVKEWTMADIQPSLDLVGKGHDFQHAKEIFESAQCMQCHRFGNEGGAIGPDLTAVSSRFTRRDVLESILEPSKVISEQYMNTAIKTADGKVIEGRILEENDEKLVIQPNPLAPEKLTVKKSDIKSRALSKLSPMPQGLVDTFTKEEILDLLAYLESGGRKDHPDFAK